ncbi:HIST1H1A (predicted), partial [Pycnogonum litorale]
ICSYLFIEFYTIFQFRTSIMPESTAAVAPPSSPKKTSKSKKAKSASPQGPTTSAMVMNAVKTLHDRNGSSLSAIKKFLTSEYKVDVSKRSSLIRKCLTTAAADGKLVRTKGTGANGSFKLSSADKTTKKTSPKKAVKSKKSSSKKPVAKKAVPSKKSSAKKLTSKKSSTPAKKPSP